MTQPTLTAEHLRGMALTIMIGAGFAAGWGLNGSAALPGAARIIAALLVLVISVAWLALAYRLRRAAGQQPAATGQGVNPFGTRSYRIAVIAECIAIPMAARLLTATGHPDAIISAVATIVGLHFFGLIGAFRSWSFAVVGGAMALLGLASLVVAPQVALVGSGEMLALRAAVVSFGCALILWASLIPLAAATRRYLARRTV